MMILGISMGEEVIADANLPLRLQEALMIMLEDLKRRQAAFVGFDRDRRAVAVGAADHQHMIAPQAMITGEDIGRQVSASQMPDMQIAIGVGPGHRYVDIFP